MALAASDPVVVPQAWKEIIEKALAKKPEDRYQDARSMLSAIRRIGAVESAPASSSAPPSDAASS